MKHIVWEKLWRRLSAFVSSIVLVILTLSAVTAPIAVHADTVPPSGTPATVSADGLPTVQINGVVWAQVIVGNTVYATGSFTSARPAGSPSGVNETPRSNLLAFDLTTGNLITSFNHPLNAQGKAIAASPDGSTLYVGGDFTTVDGVAHNHIVAINLPTNTVVSSFSDGVNGEVKSLAATNADVYAGGDFTATTHGVTRTRLAEFTNAGSLTGWNVAANLSVAAMVMTTDQSKLVVGGNFSTLNGVTYHALGAINPTTGALLPWGSQSNTYPIRQDSAGSNASITSLSANASAIFLTSFNTVFQAPGAFEGRAAISPTDGHIIWANDCHGDSYSAIPIGNVLYSVSHAHDCSSIGGFPEGSLTDSSDPHHHALAETTYATGGVNSAPANPKYWSFAGLPTSTQLNWYPTLGIGTYTGMYQAAWSVTGNSNYISLGGEFPTVNGVAQQGLVRFAISSLAPNKIGPNAYSAADNTLFVATPAASNGTAFVNWPTTWDKDNGVLTYRIYRDGGTTPVYSTTADSRFWIHHNMYFTDSGLAAGSFHSYRLVVSDPFGNSTSMVSSSKVLIDDNSPSIHYSAGWTLSDPRNLDTFDNTGHYTTTNGATASLTFNGNTITLVAEQYSNYGNMSVVVDGHTPITVSAPTGSRLNRQFVFTLENLPNGNHTITVSKLNSTYVVIDGFLVGSSPTNLRVGTFTANDTSNNVAYAGTGWQYSINRNFGDYNNDEHATTTNGASASFVFSGTSVTAFGEKDTATGNVQVWLDGVYKGTVNMYSATRVAQQQIYSISGLASQVHTLKLVKVSGSWMEVDGFTYTGTSFWGV